MPISPVGPGAATSPSTSAATSIDSTEFLRLFVRTLQTQDPTKPMEQGELLSQMAQFANLEQVRQSNEALQSIAFASATSQAVALVGRKVEIDSDGGAFVGKVTAIEFTQAGPLLTVLNDSDPDRPVYLTQQSLSQVRRVLQ